MELAEPLGRAVDAYLKTCIVDQSPPNVSELARELNVSRFRLTRDFHRANGITLDVYFRRQWMSYAMELLRTTDLPIGMIAEGLGFSDESSLRRTFKHAFGMTPAAYRRACQSVLDA